MTKYTEIVQLATAIKNYVEKNKKFPTKITVNKTTYTYAESAYLLSKSITNIGKDITKISVKKCQKAYGVKINEKVKPSDYKDQAKRVAQYIKQHGQCPNYTKTVKSKKEVRPRDFIYAFARIIVYYNKNKAWPNYCLYNSSIYTTTATSSSSSSKTNDTSVIKKYGRSTKSGCDNRGQNTGYYCACHMAQEIIRNLCGIVIPQSKIAAIMGTTSSGTGHPGIETFFAWFNKNYPKYKLTWTWKNFSELGWNGLKKILESKNQDAGLHEKYRNTWGHYTNFDKIYENTIDVHNSLGSMCTSTCYCGYTENRTKSEARSYLNGISQKSVFIVTRVK